MEQMRRQKSLESVSMLGSPRLSQTEQEKREELERLNRMKYQPQAIIKNKFYERIQTENYLTTHKPNNLKISSKLSRNSSVDSRNNHPGQNKSNGKNPLKFTYSTKKPRGLVGILKNFEGSSYLSSNASIISSSKNPSMLQFNSKKKKKGVQFDSKIHLETGIEKLKEEGQFRKAKRKK